MEAELEHKLLQSVLNISCCFSLSGTLVIRSFHSLLNKGRREMDGKAARRLH